MATCKDCVCSEVCYYKAFNDEKHLKKRRDDVEKICKSFVHRDRLNNAPIADAVEVEKYNNLREAFVDYVCSGSPSPAPWCKNRNGMCVNGWGHCLPESGNCQGFNPDGEGRQDG